MQILYMAIYFPPESAKNILLLVLLILKLFCFLELSLTTE